MADFRDRLRAVRYDWVLDCQGLIKSALVARIARTQRRAGPGWQSAREPIASLGYDLRADVPWNLHVVERNRAIGAAAFGYRLDGPAGFGLQVPSFRPDWLTDEPGATTRSARPLAVLITGASRSQKLWPDAHWIEVARALRARGYRLVWFWGSPGEHERASRLAAACGSVRQVGDVPVAASERGMTGDAGAAHASGPVAGADSIIPPFLSVGDAAGLLAAGAIVIGLDTGFTHLAGALGRPTIGIFCDFDATQCAVSGDGFCASFGGVGKVPTTTDILDAIEQALSSK